MCPSLMPSSWCSWEGEGKCQPFLKGSQELNAIKLSQKCPIVALPPAQGQTSLGKMCWPQISSGASFWSETQVKAWPGEEKSRAPGGISAQALQQGHPYPAPTLTLRTGGK